MLPQTLLARSATFALGITTVALLQSCSEAQSVYFPLEPGRHWQYKIEKNTMDGRVTQKYLLETVPPKDFNGVTVGAKQTLNGHQFYYRVDERGVSRVGYQLNGTSSIQSQTPTLLVLPRDLHVGQSWQQPTQTSALESSGAPWETLFRVDESVEMTYVIESIDDEISVSAGRFDKCVRVFGSGTTTANIGSYIGQTTVGIEVTEWYAPNIGLVMSRRSEQSDAALLSSGSLAMELEFY